MSNPELFTQNEYLKDSSTDYLIKSELCLFNFSNLKSSALLTLSKYNTFNYDFSLPEEKELKNKQKSPVSEPDKYRYIKNINIDMPSTKKLLNEEFKSNFLNSYDESYAKFCGLNQDQFSEIYINNQYIPKVNEFGDINISVKSMVNIIDTYSHSNKLKITRRAHKRNRIKKKLKMINSNLSENKFKNLFKIEKLDKENDKKNNEEPENENSKENDEKINSPENIQNSPSLIDSSIKSNENQKTKTLLDVKKNLSNIAIPTFRANKEKNINNTQNSNTKNFSVSNNDNLLINENNITNSNFKFKSLIPGDIENQLFTNNQYILSNQSFKQNSQNQNSNIFNFSFNITNNKLKSPENKSANEILDRQPMTPFNNNINHNNNTLNLSLDNNLNYNATLARPLLSPMYFGEDMGNVLSPNIYKYPKSNIASPFLANASPFNNNTHNQNFNDNFLFNNNVNSSFIDNNNENNDTNFLDNNINDIVSSHDSNNNDNNNQNLINDKSNNNNKNNSNDNNSNKGNN